MKRWKKLLLILLVFVVPSGATRRSEREDVEWYQQEYSTHPPSCQSGRPEINPVMDNSTSPIRRFLPMFYFTHAPRRLRRAVLNASARLGSAISGENLGAGGGVVVTAGNGDAALRTWKLFVLE